MTDMGPGFLWQSTPVLICSICIADTKESQPKVAVTVIRGYAVCADHAELVGFTDEIITRLKGQK